MQDRELVEAIAAGDHDGLTEAYDRFAAPLYAYCLSLLTGSDAPGQAAGAVADTFAIATVKVAGLTDPGQLQAWLHAVARNECLRRAGPAAGPAAEPAPGAAELDLLPPPELHEQVLQACTDSTPAGRANRMSMAHRAGPFGRNGFPVVAGAAGPGWWLQVRRHPRVAAGLAAAAVAVVLAGTAWAVTAGSPHRGHALVVALGGGGFATSAPSSGSPTVRPSPSAGPASSSPAVASAPAAVVTSATARAPAPASRSPAPARPSVSSSASSSPSASPSPSPSRSPSSSPPPTPGTLQVTPRTLTLTAAAGQAVSGTIIVTAVGGPVHFTISSGSAKVVVSPSSGSLGAAGTWQAITVTARSLIAVSTHLVVNPGNISVTVVLTIKV